jgi:uncharacterized membrane protein YgcG
MMPNIIIILFLLFILLVLLAIDIAIKSNIIKNCKITNLKYGGTFQTVGNDGGYTRTDNGRPYGNKCGLIAIWDAIRTQHPEILDNNKLITKNEIFAIGDTVNDRNGSDLTDDELNGVIAIINRRFTIKLNILYFDKYNEGIVKAFGPCMENDAIQLCLAHNGKHYEAMNNSVQISNAIVMAKSRGFNAKYKNLQEVIDSQYSMFLGIERDTPNLYRYILKNGQDYVQLLNDNDNNFGDARDLMISKMNSTGIYDKEYYPQYTTMEEIATNNVNVYAYLTTNDKLLAYINSNNAAFIDYVNRYGIDAAIIQMQTQLSGSSGSSSSSSGSSGSSDSSSSSSSSSDSSSSSSKWVPSPDYRAVNALLFERYKDVIFTQDEINYIIQKCP